MTKLQIARGHLSFSVLLWKDGGMWRIWNFTICYSHLTSYTKVSWWRHQMKTFSALLALFRGTTGDRWTPLTICYSHLTSYMQRSWWRHQMETSSALLALCKGNPPVTGGSPHKGQWRGALVFSSICVYSIVYSGSHERKHQSSTALAIVRGIHRWPVNSSHKGPVTRKMSSFDDVIILCKLSSCVVFRIRKSNCMGSYVRSAEQFGKYYKEFSPHLYIRQM